MNNKKPNLVNLFKSLGTLINRLEKVEKYQEKIKGFPSMGKTNEMYGKRYIHWSDKSHDLITQLEDSMSTNPRFRKYKEKFEKIKESYSFLEEKNYEDIKNRTKELREEIGKEIKHKRKESQRKRKLEDQLIHT